MAVMVRTSYSADDVVFLLKDITGMVNPLPADVRESAIQKGTSYSEMIPLEYQPSDEYMAIYREALQEYGLKTALSVGAISKQIIEHHGRNVVLVSLARAGTPVGVLVKRYIKSYYSIDPPHFSLSIIRGKGIDNNALRYLMDQFNPEQIQFIDGWTGKGAIVSELEQALAKYPEISKRLAVLADPAGVAAICGTNEDILIPSACLNATVSGLISRTFHRADLIGREDYHGAVYYAEQAKSDLTYSFISAIESLFIHPDALPPENDARTSHEGGSRETGRLAAEFGITDLNLIKPGIGETVRVLLRRIPWKVLVCDATAAELRPIIQLARDRNIEIVQHRMKHYKACGLIRKLA
jgi:hypothetical protein